MIGLFKAIAEVAGLLKNLNDPAKRREAYELKLDKKAYKAIEAAEKFILGYDSYTAERITKRQWGVLYRKYKKRFFEND